MRDRSVKTLIDCRDPARHELDLGMRDRTILVREVAHRRSVQVLRIDKVEEPAQVLGCERQSAHYVGARHAIEKIGFLGSVVAGNDRLDPRSIVLRTVRSQPTGIASFRVWQRPGGQYRFRA